MADVEVQVIARAIGFDALAAQAERASAAFKNLAAATKGANVAGGASAKQLADDMRRVTNGMNIGGQIGADIRKGMQASLSNGGFWNNMFTGLNSRFKTAGKNFGRSFRAGLEEATRSLRGSGGHGVTQTQLMGGVVAGYGAFEFLKSVAEAASNREQARLNLASLGPLTSKDQRVTLERLADSASTKYGNISGTEGLEFLTSMLQIQGHVDELFAGGGKGANLTSGGASALDRIFGLMSFMKTFEGGKHAGNASSVVHEFESSIRGSELAGRLKPEEMADWLTRSVKTSIAYGVTPSQMLAAQRAGGTAFLGLNEHGLAAFSAYTQEQKQRAGVQLMSFVSRMVGGTGQSWMSNEALRGLGLINEDDIKNHPGAFQLRKDGKISRVLDTKMYSHGTEITQDPFHWLTDVFYPALAEKVKSEDGIDLGDISKPLSERSEAEKDAMIRRTGMTFGNRSNAIIALEALIQAQNIEKRARVYDAIDLGEGERSKSFLHQTQTFSDQMDQLKTNLGETILPSLNDYLTGFNSKITAMSGYAKEHSWFGKAVEYGAETAMVFGGAALARLMWHHVFQWPLSMAGRLIGGAGWLAAGALGGLFSGGKALFGGVPGILGSGIKGASAAAVAGGAGLAALSARVSKWIGSIGAIGKVLGSVGKLIGLLGRLFLIYQVGDWVYNTDLGSTAIASAKEKIDAYLHPGSSHGKEQLALKHYWARDRALRKRHPLWASVTTPVAYPDYLKTLIGPRAKYVDFAHDREWLKHIQLPNDSFFSRMNFSGSGARGGPNVGGQKSGPIPVVVQSMPKGQDRPNNITTNVTVNVQSNASPQAIGNAAGSAVSAKVMGALSDQHH